MIQRNITYPKFESGQLLSSDLLNRTTGFLEEQDRLTRANLIGMGVINGLTYSYKKNKLTIKPGMAITADGFIINIQKETTYTICSKYLDFFKENLPLDEKNKISSSPSFRYLKNYASYVLFEDSNEAFDYNASNCGFPKELDEFVVTLVVDFPETSQVSCNQISCDRYVKKTNMVVHPVLVLKDISTNNKFPCPYRKLSSINKVVELDSLSSFDTALNVNVLLDRTKDLFIKNCGCIKDSLDEILKEFVADGRCLDWKSVIPEYRDKIKKLIDCKDRFKSWVENYNYKELPQYFLLFLEDMACAINEFVSFYNVFVCKYPYIRTSHVFIDRIVAINKTGTEDEYLYRFCPAQVDKNFEIDCQTLDKLFCRLFKLSVSFLGHRYLMLKKKSKKSWSRDKRYDISFFIKKLNCPMGENEMPFYYDNDVLSPYWNAFSLFDKGNFNKYKKIDRSQDENNIIRFQNCYGESVDDVQKEFNEYLKGAGVSSVGIESVSIGKRKLQKKYKDALDVIFKEKVELIQSKLLRLLYERRKCVNHILVLGRNGEEKFVKLSCLSLRMTRKLERVLSDNSKNRKYKVLRENNSRIYIGRYMDRNKVLRMRSLQAKTLKSEQRYLVHANTILKVAKSLSFDINTTAKTKGVFLRDKIIGAMDSASNAKSIDKSDARAILDSIKDIKLDDFILFYEYIQDVLRTTEKGETDEEIWKLNPMKIFSTRYFASFFALKSYIEKGYNSDYENAVYCGGAKQNADVLLLYHQTGVSKYGRKGRRKQRFILELCNRVQKR